MRALIFSAFFTAGVLLAFSGCSSEKSPTNDATNQTGDPTPTPTPYPTSGGGGGGGAASGYAACATSPCTLQSLYTGTTNCLDVSSSDGVTVVMAACNGSTSQQWLVSYVGSSGGILNYQLVNQGSSKCLDGISLQLTTCSTSSSENSQFFSFVYMDTENNGTQYFAITNPYMGAGKCLDVQTDQQHLVVDILFTVNGQNVGYSGQKWGFTPTN